MDDLRLAEGTTFDVGSVLRDRRFEVLRLERFEPDAHDIEVGPW